MQRGICADCGKERLLHQHHVKGRDVDPNCVVGLCFDCHTQHHVGYGVIRNEAGQAWLKWLEGEFEAGHYPSLVQRLARMRELGYLPLPDGWMDGAPEEVFWSLICPLWIYGWMMDGELQQLYRERVAARMDEAGLDALMAACVRKGGTIPQWAR